MESKKTRIIIYLILAAVIAVQLGMNIWIFSCKTSNMEDEFFSYGLANSFGRPFLYGSKLYTPDNTDVMMSGDDFRYYISVREGESFSYGNVLSNQKQDTLPPLYPLMIHTICSFFPERFSWWWGFGINIAAFLLSQVVMFLLFSKLSGSKVWGLGVTALWGFTAASQNMQIYIRMYSLTTLFVLLFTYFSVSVICNKDGELRVAKQLVPVTVFTALGALTQHIFLIYAFFFTLLSCLLMLFKRRIREAFGLGISALGGVLISLALFPAAIDQLFGSNTVQWSEEINFSESLHFMDRLLLGELTGHYMSIWRTSIGAYILVAVICLALPLAAVMWLFRKSGWVKNTLSSAKKWAADSDHALLITAAAAVIYHLFISSRIYYYDLGESADRYIFFSMLMIFGCVLTGGYLFVNALCRKLGSVSGREKAFGTAGRAVTGLAAAALAAVLCIQNLADPHQRLTYCLSSGETNGKVCSYTKGSNCLVVLYSPMVLPCFCEMLGGAEKVYVTSPADKHYESCGEEFSPLYEDGSEFYCLVPWDVVYSVTPEGKTEETDIIPDLEKITGRKAEQVTQETVHSMDMLLYRFEG